MSTKTLKVLSFIFILMPAIFIFGCTTSTTNFEGMVEIIYHLEGGTYKASTEPVKQYYYKPDGDTQLVIFDITTASGQNLTKEGYVFDGWYKVKEEVNGISKYSEPFDFKSDFASIDGMTLYAKWSKAMKFYYDLCYIDEEGKEQIIHTYEAAVGESFYDYDDYLTSKIRSGYTCTRLLFDKDNNPWDNNFVHPGDEENPVVKVYTTFIEGDYKVVTTKNEFTKALYSNSNIYLMDDIDMGNEKLSFEKFTKQLIGNGHKISNITIQYGSTDADLKVDLEDTNMKSLYISLFDDMKNVTIQDVTFENVFVEINTIFSKIYKIYVAPFAVTAESCKISNVTLNGSYAVKRLPEDFDVATNLVVITDKAVVESIDSELENININFKEQTND